MTDAKDQARKRRVDRGGLPVDDQDLSAFAAQAREAFGEPGASGARPALAAVPATAQAPPLLPDAAAAEPADTAARPAPAAGQPANQAADHAEADELDDEEFPEEAPVRNIIRQATFRADEDIARRFRQYQKREGRKGPEPGNGEVVFRALIACDGHYRDIVAARMPQAAPGQRFGAPVPGRRTANEAKVGRQINFRPTHGEVADIRRIKKQAGAGSVTALLNAVLDEFLPPLRGGTHGGQH